MSAIRLSEDFTPEIGTRTNNQLTGNVGLYYVCYRLSRLGWNVLPTSRNARGVDIVVYDQKGKRRHTIQVKTLSTENNIPLGSDSSPLLADYLVICRNVSIEPELFVAEMAEARHAAINHKGGLWIPTPRYEKFDTRLEAVVGRGN